MKQHVPPWVSLKSQQSILWINCHNQFVIYSLGKSREFHLYSFQLKSQNNTDFWWENHIRRLRKNILEGAWKPQAASQGKQCLLNICRMSAGGMQEEARSGPYLLWGLLLCSRDGCSQLQMKLIKPQHSWARKWSLFQVHTCDGLSLTIPLHPVQCYYSS